MTNKKTEEVEAFALDLDPTVPLPEQVRRGNYGYVNPALTPENFRLTVPAGKRRVVLYDPHGFVSSEEMIRRMRADGCVPATLDDALAMGAKHTPIASARTPWCSWAASGVILWAIAPCRCSSSGTAGAGWTSAGSTSAGSTASVSPPSASHSRGSPEIIEFRLNKTNSNHPHAS